MDTSCLGAVHLSTRTYCCTPTVHQASRYQLAGKPTFAQQSLTATADRAVDSLGA
jgi:hypothetical protein